jgi:predicted nuclease of predicted toxin-antitoxin system
MKTPADASLISFWIDFRQSAGIEAVHWWSVGKGDAPDVELLNWAVERDAIILTGDAISPRCLRCAG